MSTSQLGWKGILAVTRGLLGGRKRGGWLPLLREGNSRRPTRIQVYIEFLARRVKFSGQRLVEFHILRLGFLFWGEGGRSSS